MPAPLRLLALALVPGLLAAQSPAAVQRAVQSITPVDIQRRIAVIADDSMRGRDTPSPELEEVANYIAGEFRRFGLRPGGDNGTFLQRYALERVQFVPESSIATIAGGAGGADTTIRYGADFVFGDNMIESGEYAGELVLVSGSLGGAASADTAAFAGKILVLAAGFRNRGERQRVLAWKPAGVVILSPVPDSLWVRVAARNTLRQLRDPSRRVGPPVWLVLRTAALTPVLGRLGVDLAAAQGATAFAVTPLGARMRIRATLRSVERHSAPNVVGILEGSDPQLKSEYVVLSAHMDHVGVGRPVNGDSIYNGADDDASGTISVVEAAEAFARLTPRPKRSLVFLTVSGEEKGLWGSAFFVENPTVPVAGLVANLNIDMVGRNWKDTVVAIGKEHSDLGASLHRVAAAHPELNLLVIDDPWPSENFYFRSDHYNFARKGVPILFFFTGTHVDYHRPSDTPDKIDAEKTARIVKLVFYLGLDVANAPRRPTWNPDSYRRIVSGQ